jgi:hypothetical protein
MNLGRNKKLQLFIAVVNLIVKILSMIDIRIEVDYQTLNGDNVHLELTTCPNEDIILPR